MKNVVWIEQGDTHLFLSEGTVYRSNLNAGYPSTCTSRPAKQHTVLRNRNSVFVVICPSGVGWHRKGLLILSRCSKGETWRGGTTDAAKMYEIIGNSRHWAGIAIMGEQGDRT